MEAKGRKERVVMLRVALETLKVLLPLGEQVDPLQHGELRTYTTSNLVGKN